MTQMQMPRRPANVSTQYRLVQRSAHAARIELEKSRGRFDPPLLDLGARGRVDPDQTADQEIAPQQREELLHHSRWIALTQDAGGLRANQKLFKQMAVGEAVGVERGSDIGRALKFRDREPIH